MTDRVALDQATQDRLVEAAKRAAERAYAPYSNFQVGAALLLSDGQIIEGANIENASYPAGICAERSAAAVAINQGRRDFVAIAVIGPPAEPITPCGICRQFLSEFNKAMPVLCCGRDGSVQATTLAALLPGAFDQQQLEQAG